MDFIKNFLPISSIKLPKLKKLRQWSHDQVSNLGQMAGLTLSNGKVKRNSFDENQQPHIPINGISTISAAIREQQINPRKDNYGLYALKQDRSVAFENAKRGILLSIPTTTAKAATTSSHHPSRIRTKAEVHSFHSMERNHEIFQSCEKVVNSSGLMYEDATSLSSKVRDKEEEVTPKVEPPPRRKKRQTATKQILHHKQPPPRMPVVRQAQMSESYVKDEKLERNDSELYRRIVTEKAKVVMEEPTMRCKKEQQPHVVTMVKPKIQRAEKVKFQYEKTAPVIAKVKSYEWQKHQRKASIGNINVNNINGKPPLPTKKATVGVIGNSNNNNKKNYIASENSSFRSDNSSVDIFQSNRLRDQQRLFDEFDELFKKHKSDNNLVEDDDDDDDDGDENEEPTAETALRKLRELKKSSSVSSSSSSFCVGGKKLAKPSPDDVKPSSMNVKSLSNKNMEDEKEKVDNVKTKAEEIHSTKPKIVFEQPKATAAAVTGIIKKKVIYYDDKQELQQLIMNQTQSTMIINNHFNSQILPNQMMADTPTGGAVKSLVKSTGQPLEDYRNSKSNQIMDMNANSMTTTTTTLNTANGNHLKIFSNEGIFVFNL